MLAKIAPRFVISRVIQNSYLAENQAIQLLKIPLGLQQKHFALIDPQDYYTVRFYGYISTLTKPDSFSNKYEQQAYQKACERFKNFNQTLQVFERLAELQSEARILYGYIQRNNSSSNLFSQSLQTNKNFQKDVLSSIERYTKVEDSLKEFPEWQEKVKEDIGSFYHIIHNNLAESESKRNIFNKLHRQQFFL